MMQEVGLSQENVDSTTLFKKGVNGELVSLSENEIKELEKKFKKVMIDCLREENLFTETPKENKKNQLNEKKIESLKQELKKVEKERLQTLTRQFAFIFAKKPSTEELESIYQTYLADGSFSVEESKEGAISMINSMKPVINYLSKNTEVTKLDFRTFKDKINDIGTLVSYLKTSKITMMAFKNIVPEEIKKSLAELKGITVKYFN